MYFQENWIAWHSNSCMCTHIPYITEVPMLSCLFNLTENIALHKLAVQQHPFLHRDFSYIIFYDFSASNAVDGLKTDCSAYGGQCTLSAVNKRVALWYVDLGSILSIHHITIYYRTDNVTWGKYQSVYL